MVIVRQNNYHIKNKMGQSASESIVNDAGIASSVLTTTSLLSLSATGWGLVIAGAIVSVIEISKMFSWGSHRDQDIENVKKGIINSLSSDTGISTSIINEFVDMSDLVIKDTTNLSTKEKVYDTDQDLVYAGQWKYGMLQTHWYYFSKSSIAKIAGLAIVKMQKYGVLEKKEGDNLARQSSILQKSIIGGLILLGIFFVSKGIETRKELA